MTGLDRVVVLGQWRGALMCEVSGSEGVGGLTALNH